MSEWKEYRFSEFAQVNPPVKLKSGESYSFVEMKDLSDGQKFCEPSIERELSGGSKFENGDTLFARITPCLENGKICQVRNLKNGVGFGSTEFYVFRGRDNVSDSDFVFYLSRWDEVRSFAEMNFDGTSGRQRVPREAFDNLYLTLPGFKTQQKIVSLLSGLDNKIDLLTRQNKTLEQLAETYFRQWFVEQAEDSWVNGKVGDLFTLQRGFDLPEQNRQTGPYPIITASGINAMHYEFKVNAPGVTTGRSGTIGEVFYVDSDFWPLNTSLFVKEYKIGGPLFAYYFLKTMDLAGLNSGSAVPTLNRNDVHAVDTFIPPLERVNQFEESAHSLRRKISSNNKQMNDLRTLRDTLLPKLMSGEIVANEL